MVRKRNPLLDLGTILVVAGGAFVAWKMGWLGGVGLLGGTGAPSTDPGASPPPVADVPPPSPALTEDQAALILWWHVPNKLGAVYGSSLTEAQMLSMTREWWTWERDLSWGSSIVVYVTQMGWA